MMVVGRGGIRKIDDELECINLGWKGIAIYEAYEILVQLPSLVSVPPSSRPWGYDCP